MNVDSDVDDDLLSDATVMQENAPSKVVEEESLRYIGGYIVRKFRVKYPHLGEQNADCPSNRQSWIGYINRGALSYPSEDFMSQLLVMRNTFNEIHALSLKEGKDCVNTIAHKLKVDVHDLPSDVIRFFAKISVYFRMRHLNKDLKLARKRGRSCRSEDKKRRKIIG